MKRNLTSLVGYALGATDGEIGKIKEFYFDDETWTIRYLIVETGNWLSGRKVLISPEALLSKNWDAEVLPVNLTKEKIANSPDIDTERPFSRQQEIKLIEYYPWTNYWGWDNGQWLGGMGTSGMMTSERGPFEQAIHNSNAVSEKAQKDDPHLRSTDKIKGYHIKAIDGEVGEIADFIIDDDAWKIKFLVVDTGNWFSGKKVLFSPGWIKKIDWINSSIVVKASVNDIKSSPEYDHGKPLSESDETELNKYYETKV
ncbi:MAG: PRC-barrel domain-containing protein [Ferruginibacter sp.]